MIKKKRLAIILSLLLVCSLSINSSIVEAKTLGELEDEIAEKQAELQDGLAEEESLASQLTELEGSVYELNDQIDIAEDELEVLEADLEEAKELVDTQNGELGGRLRNMYKHGSVGFLDVLLNSGSFSEFLTNLDMVTMIFSSDKEVLEGLQEAHDEIATKTQEVKDLKDELTSARDTAEANMIIIEEQKAAIAADNEEADAMLRSLESEAAAVAAELALQSGNGTISNSDSSTYSGGAFTWPTPGYTTITSDYGWRICPFHGKEFHGALDIGADSGSNIVAAASGTVISASWNGGFGYSVKIDHGGGLVTMYNHCSSLLVSSGSYVSRGQTIAKVGSTGSSTGPHLDYRVFKDGSTMNPFNYH